MRRRACLLLAALGLLLVGGCLGSEEDTREDSEDGEANASLGFDTVQPLPEEPRTAEPNAITGPDGQVWVVAPGSQVEQPNVHDAEAHLWRSEDRGGSWTPLRTTSYAEDGSWCSCDTDLSLGPEGTLYLTDFWVSETGLNGFVVQASDDGGQSFDEGNFLSTTNPAANDRQYVTAGNEPGVVYLSYARGTLGPEGEASADAGLHLWRSEDGGDSFTQRTQVVEAGDSFPLIAKPHVGPDDTVYFPWYEVSSDDPTAGTAEVRLGVSTDGGQSFEVREVAQATGWGIWPLQATVGPDGTVHLVWMDRLEDGGAQLQYTHTSGAAENFAEVRTVTWEEGTAVLPWITAAGPGRAAIGFYGTAERVVPTQAPEDTRWDAWATVVEADGAALEPVRASPFPVKVGPMCPNGAGCSEDRELLDYPAIAWDEDRLTFVFAASTLDEGAGPQRSSTATVQLLDPAPEPEGGHDAAANLYVARAELPAP